MGFQPVFTPVENRCHSRSESGVNSLLDNNLEARSLTSRSPITRICCERYSAKQVRGDVGYRALAMLNQAGVPADSPDMLDEQLENSTSDRRSGAQNADRRSDSTTADQRNGDQEKDRRKTVVDRRSGMDRRRGPGRRRGEVRRAAEEGEHAGELLEFIMAIDQYKRINDRPFPSWSEVFEIIQYLGYRKVADRADHINTASGSEVLGEPIGSGASD